MFLSRIAQRRSAPALAACALVHLAAVSHVRVARAQGAAEQPPARSVPRDAQEARLAGRHAEALALAERAAVAGASPALRTFLAEEHLALGHFVEAAREADRAQYEATSGAGAGLEARLRAVLDAVNPRVGRIVVRVAPTVTAANVRLNREPIARASLNAPYAVAPGPLVIEADAPGAQTERYDVVVRAGGRSSVELQLTQQPGAAASEPAHTAPPPPSSETAPAPAASNVATVAYVRSPAGLVVGAVGAAVFFTGVGFGAASEAEFRGLQTGRAACPGPVDCDARADRVGTFDTVANVGMIAGGALAITGTVLFLVLRVPAVREREREPAASLWVTPRGAGVTASFKR